MASTRKTETGTITTAAQAAAPLIEALAVLQDRLPGIGRLVVAYSGGRDSHCLLDVLARYRPLPLPLVALHVDHGLQDASRTWSYHCARVCAGLGVGLEVIEIDARPRAGEGPEAAAREARYRAMAERLGPGDCLVTAHHRDDQAETLLLQLLRGSGIHGLAGMPFVRPLGQGRHVRPWLATDRGQIESYVHAHGLDWVEDPSNADVGLRRNRLRHEIIPELERHWPAARRTLARTAGLLAEGRALLDVLAGIDRAACVADDGTLTIAALARLEPVRQRNLLRYWLHEEVGLPLPGSRHLDRIVEDLLTCRPDRQGRVDWSGGEVRVWRGRLHAAARMPRGAGMMKTLGWLPTEQPALTLPDGARLRLRPASPGQKALRRELIASPMNVRFRRGGERCRLAGRPQRRRLKSLFQEAGIPPWRRARLPLLYCGSELVAIPGIGVCEGFAANADEGGLELVYEVDGEEYAGVISRTTG